MVTVLTEAQSMAFLESIANPQVALTFSIATNEWMKYVNSKNYYYLNCHSSQKRNVYQNNSVATVPTPAAGFKIYDPSVANQLNLTVRLQELHTFGATPTLIPKDATTGTSTLTSFTRVRTFSRYMFPTGTPTNDIDRWFAMVASDPNIVFKPSQWLLARNRVEIHPLRMNDLGQHVTPFYKSNSTKRL